MVWPICQARTRLTATASASRAAFSFQQLVQVLGERGFDLLVTMEIPAESATFSQVYAWSSSGLPRQTSWAPGKSIEDAVQPRG